jgi:AraC-like DNA-binding protein
LKFYSEYKLKNESRFVNKIWSVDNSTQKTDIPNLKILPNGCFNIALLIGNGALITLKNKKYNFNQGIYLCSQFTEAVNLTLCKYSKVILIQIQASYFSYYLKNDFNNFVDDISESGSGNELFNENIDLNNPLILQDVIDLTENHFLNFSKEHPEKNIVEQAISKIALKKGNCKISDILKDSNHSERWLQLRFKKATGLTPKQYAKIIQFRDSIDKIAYDSSSDSLTSISYQSGFNDQSHFIKSFHQFLGITPSKFNPKEFVLSFKK